MLSQASATRNCRQVDRKECKAMEDEGGPRENEDEQYAEQKNKKPTQWYEELAKQTKEKSLQVLWLGCVKILKTGQSWPVVSKRDLPCLVVVVGFRSGEAAIPHAGHGRI